MLNDYENVTRIGKGSFSEVFKASHKITKRWVAIKRIKIELFNKYKIRILAELDIIKKLRHPNILEFFDIYQSKNHIYILSELCDSTLTKIINISMSEKQIFDIYSQVINGIKYLYDHKIFHRDIKPENILIKDDVIKIADFGFAKEINDYNKVMDTICGSPLFMAPEIVLNKPYSIKSDIWSLGIILYQMMYQNHPYGEVKNIIQLVNNYNVKTKILYPKKNYSEDLINLVKNMLIYDADQRLSWEKLFSHEWFNGSKITINMTEQSLLKSDVILDENLMFGDLNNSKTDSEIYDSVKNSKNNSNLKYNENYYGKSEPIKIINKKNNDSDIIDSRGPNLSIPKTDSLKIQIADKHINLNEDHFGESVIHPFIKNRTFPPGNKLINNNNNKLIKNASNVKNDNVKNDNTSENEENYSAWDFIKKSVKFFSL